MTFKFVRWKWNINENEISILCYIETFNFQYNDVSIIIWHLICLRYHFNESCRNVRHNDDWISRWFWCASRRTKLPLILYRKKLPKLFKFIFIDSHHYVSSSRWIAAIDFWWKVNFVVFYLCRFFGHTLKTCSDCPIWCACLSIMWFFELEYGSYFITHNSMVKVGNDLLKCAIGVLI